MLITIKIIFISYYFFKTLKIPLPIYFLDNYDKSLQLLKKALKIRPGDIEYLRCLGHLGQIMQDPDIELDALTRMHQYGLLDDGLLPALANFLVDK